VGTALIPREVMLFCSILFGEDAPFEEALCLLKENFGDLAYRSETMPFVFTNYYEREFGSGLVRFLFAFDRLVQRNALVEAKIITNQIESTFIHEGKRRINIDPGILTQENICLATTKPYSHRIYLDKGIWAEVTLIYRKDSYHALEWSYPDYSSAEMIGIFNSLRETYRGKL